MEDSLREMHRKKIAGIVQKLPLQENETQALIELVTYLKETWPVAQCILFGSKASGFFDEESDLDLLILLPCPVTQSIRKEIIHKVFDLNLAYEANMSPLLLAEEEWNNGDYSLLPIHYFIEREGVSL